MCTYTTWQWSILQWGVNMVLKRVRRIRVFELTDYALCLIQPVNRELLAIKERVQFIQVIKLAGSILNICTFSGHGHECFISDVDTAPMYLTDMLLSWTRFGQISKWRQLNPSNAEATFVQRTSMHTLSCWYSLDSPHRVLSHEYPCTYTRVSVILGLFCIGKISHQQYKG